MVPVSGADASALSLDVGGKDVTSAFARRENGRFMGLVTGLANGDNVLTAKLADGSKSSITITNHPISGPLLYGPQVQPWACDAGATDTQCDRAVVYAYKYISSNPALKGFQTYDPVNPATDVATTTTDQGKAVPFVVRVETGVQDRDYYNVAVLFDPTKPWMPWDPQAGWNSKVLVMHGGRDPLIGVEHPQALLRGLRAARLHPQHERTEQAEQVGDDEEGARVDQFHGGAKEVKA